MPAEYRLALRLTADAKGFVGAVTAADKRVGRLAGTVRRSSSETKQAAGALKLYGAQGQVVSTVSTRQAAAVDRAARAADRAGRASAGAARRTRGLASAFLAAHGRAIAYGLGLGGGLLVSLRQLGGAALDAAEANRELDNRLRLVTESEAELAAVRSQLLDVSVRTRTAIDGTVVTYSRLALALEHLDRPASQSVRVVELLNKQLAIGGSVGSEAQAGLIQFAQGLASGRLQGDELRSVMENLLGVQQGLIIGFRKLRESGQIDIDVTRANLRELASEGEITAERLIDAVLASGEWTDRTYESVEAGIRSSFRALRNEIRESFREGLEETSGFVAATVQRMTEGMSRARRIRSQTVRVYELDSDPLTARDLIGMDEQEMRDLVGGFVRELEAVAEGAGVTADSIIGRRLAALLQPRIDILREELQRAGEIDPSGAAAPPDPSAEPDPERLREMLRLEREFATARERIQLDYQDRVRKIEAVADGEQRERLLRRAETIRSEGIARLGKIADREREAQERAAAADRERADSAQASAAALVLLREENERLRQGGLEALKVIEEEREARELLAQVRRAHADATPQVLAGLEAEALAERKLTKELEAQAESRNARMQAFVGWMSAGSAASGEAAGEQADLAGSLGVADEALRRITGGLGQFANANAKAFRLHQAAALASAAVSTAKGATDVLADTTIQPTWLRPVMMGLILAAGAAQIAAIRSQRPPQAFAYGGVIDRRAEFSFGGGRRGLAGEAGPEAILPLRRLPSGRLGVGAAAGGRAPVFAPRVEVVVQAPMGGRPDDAALWGREAGRGVATGLRPLFLEFVREERRPLGALDPDGDSV